MSLVGAAGSCYPLYTCYANGRYWVFYDAPNLYIKWRSSTDGSSWSSEYTYTISKQEVEMTHDGNYVHIVLNTPSAVNPSIYLRGLMNSDGTITWDSEDTFLTPDGTHVQSAVTIKVDSSGYPWVVFSFTDVSAGKSTVKVEKSSTKDGTWTTASGFPYSVFVDNPYAGGWQTRLAPISANGMYVMQYFWGATPHLWQGRIYNGSTWGSVENIPDGGNYYVINVAQPICIADSDDIIHIIGYNTSTDQYEYYQRSTGGVYTLKEYISFIEPNYHKIACDGANNLYLLVFDDVDFDLYRSKYTTFWSDLEEIDTVVVGLSEPTVSSNSKLIWATRKGGNLYFYSEDVPVDVNIELVFDDAILSEIRPAYPQDRTITATDYGSGNDTSVGTGFGTLDTIADTVFDEDVGEVWIRVVISDTSETIAIRAKINSTYYPNSTGFENLAAGDEALIQIPANVKGETITIEAKASGSTTIDHKFWAWGVAPHYHP